MVVWTCLYLSIEPVFFFPDDFLSRGLVEGYLMQARFQPAHATAPGGKGRSLSFAWRVRGLFKIQTSIKE